MNGEETFDWLTGAQGYQPGEADTAIAAAAGHGRYRLPRHLVVHHAGSWKVLTLPLSAAEAARYLPAPGQGGLAYEIPDRSAYDPVPDLAALLDGVHDLAVAGAADGLAVLGALLTGPYARLRGGLLLDEPGRGHVTTATAVREALREWQPGTITEQETRT